MGEGSVAAVLMVALQLVFAGVNIVYKLALNDGMDMHVLVVFRFAFGAAVLFPLAIFFERKALAALRWRVVMLSFLCALFGGSLSQNLYIACLKLTSATFAVAMTNLIPGMTFVLAVIFRKETLAISKFSGQAKVVGTVIGVAGAMVLTFYTGPVVSPWRSMVNLIPNRGGAGPGHEPQNMVAGSLLAIASGLCYAIWLIIQAKLSDEYPYHYSSATLMCVLTVVQSALFAAIMDHDSAQWKLGFNVRLLAAIFSGALASGLGLVVLSWCVRKKGPLYASVFNPLMLIVVAVLSSFILDDRMHLGSVIGGVLIVIGLYAVLWGKGREAAKVGEEISKEGDIEKGGAVVEEAEHQHPNSVKPVSEPPQAVKD